MSQTKGKPSFKRGFKKECDELTLQLRSELNLSKNDRLCAFELCKHLGIELLTPIGVSGLPKDHLDELLGAGSNNWSAATIPFPNRKPMIIHNPTHSPYRQQSNLMHELAHILCKHEIPKEKLELGLSGFLRNHDPLQEMEAEWLGSCLQLPRPALLWALRRGMSYQEISEHFLASEQMVKYRIRITGVQKQLSYSRSA